MGAWWHYKGANKERNKEPNIPSCRVLLAETRGGEEMMAAVAPVVHSLNSPETVATLVLSLSLSLIIIIVVVVAVAVVIVIIFPVDDRRVVYCVVPLLLSLILSFSSLFFLSWFCFSFLLLYPDVPSSDAASHAQYYRNLQQFFLSSILMESRVASHRTVHPCHTEKEKEKENMRNVSARLFTTTASLRVDKFWLCRLNLKRSDEETNWY